MELETIVHMMCQVMNGGIGMVLIGRNQKRVVISLSNVCVGRSLKETQSSQFSVCLPVFVLNLAAEKFKTLKTGLAFLIFLMCCRSKEKVTG